MATKTKSPLQFDQAKLQGMQEPLTVRVEKIKGNTPSAISLPAKEGYAPGAGWSRDEILKIEEWLVTDWSGGGYYRISVTDANGDTMRWDTIYDPRTFPEQVPPSLQKAAVPNPVVNVAQGQQQQAAPQQQQTPPQPHGTPFQQQGFPGMWPPPGAAFSSAPAQMRPNQQVPPQGPWATQGPTQQPGPWGAPPWGTPPSGPWGAPQTTFLGYNPMGQPMWGPPQPPMHTPRGSLRAFGDRPAPARRDRDRDREEYERRQREEERRRREQDEQRKRHTEELRARDEQLRQMQLQQKETAHQAALERQAQQHEQQLAALKEELRRLGEGSKNKEADEVRAAREAKERLERERERERIEAQFRALQEVIAKVAEKPTDDPKMRLMEQQLQQQRAEAEQRAREYAEQLRRTEEQRQRDMERAQWEKAQEQLQQQLAAQEHRTKEMLREVSSTRPDPMVEFMKENARLSQEQARMQAENMREIARMQQTSADRMSQMMMTPQALASMIRDSSSGADMMLKNVVGSMSGVFDVFRGAVEQITQLTGGAPEPPAARIIEQGVARAGELADRYLAVKREEVISKARVEAAQAQADAHVKATAVQAQMQAQAEAANRAAQQQQAAARMASQQAETVGRKPTNGVSSDSGLGGAAPPPPTKPVQEAKKSTQPIDDGQQDPQTGQTIAKVVPIQGKKRQGYTDEEWFGPALESVRRLRAGVKTFMDNLRVAQEGGEPEIGDDGEPTGLNPDKAVDAILKGVNYVSVNSIAVKAFDDLFKQGMFADFMDICLPEAPQPYLDDCVKILTEEVEMNITDTPPADLVDPSLAPPPA
jgi:hypothetical protein